DLVFFKHKRKINHVGIVVSNSKGHLIIIHSTTSEGVKKDDILNSKYWEKRLTFATDVISH
ncbi:MAG TPA: NlpC/P60 family protein, partial [Bacteroidetes bacterium]|nr:NlpC/P60 family protein [Bacteroidota bacterium]